MSAAIPERLPDALELLDVCPPAAYLDHPDRTEADPLAPADLKAAWQDLATRLADALDAFTPEEWLQKHTAVSDADFAKDPGRNRMVAVLSRTNHISYHMGQLMLMQNPPRGRP